jgi:hypothetical protein
MRRAIETAGVFLITFCVAGRLVCEMYQTRLGHNALSGQGL